MNADLSLDVRAEAAEKARDAAYRDSPNWGSDPHRWGGVVDAVVAAVMPEYLRAHVEALAKADQALDTLFAQVNERISILESKNADLRKLVTQLDQATVRAHNAQDRVKVLAVLLADLIDIVDASSYLTALSNGDHDRVEAARAALTVGN